MERQAVIDVGSNSIKLLLAEPGDKGSVKTVIDKSNIVRLGEGLKETGRISREAMERNCQAITEFSRLAVENEAHDVVGVGTMALRSAENSAEFLKMVKDASGVEVRVISGDEEARLAYLAVLSWFKFAGKLAIFDIGGGSTEFIFGEGETIEKKFSLDIGAIRITEEFLKSDPVTDAEVARALAEIQTFFTANDVAGKVNQLVGMGGTVTSIGSVKHELETYDPDIIQGSHLERKDIQAQIALYRDKTVAERENITGLQAKRADVILAGACIVKVIMEKIGADYLTISDRGLRHGFMYEVMGQQQ